MISAEDPQSLCSPSFPLSRNFLTNSSILDTFLGVVICIILCYGAFLLEWIQGLSDTDWKVFRLGNVILGSNNDEDILSVSEGHKEIHEKEVVAEVDITEIEEVEDGEGFDRLEIQGEDLGGGLVRQESGPDSHVEDSAKYTMLLAEDDHSLQTQEEDVSEMEDTVLEERRQCVECQTSCVEERETDTLTYFPPRDNGELSGELSGEYNVEIASNNCMEDMGGITQEEDTQVWTRDVPTLKSDKAEERSENVCTGQDTNLMIEELTLTLLDKVTEDGEHLQISFKQSRVIRKVKEVFGEHKEMEGKKIVEERVL